MWPKAATACRPAVAMGYNAVAVKMPTGETRTDRVGYVGRNRLTPT